MARWQFFVPVLAVGALLCGSCGGGSMARELKAININPTAAQPSGSATTVQFTATGVWTAAPTSVTPQGANWGACLNGTPTSDVTVTSTGLATCGADAKGTYTVWAWAPSGGTGPQCTAVTACGAGCGRVNGTAQLTCP